MRKPKKILVIDDEPDFHSQFSRILEEEGYVVISASSGEEALEKLNYENFDLVILDLVLLPNKKTGLETLEEIRRINSEIYVIISSAFATAEQAMEAVMKKGAQTYIKKPFNILNVKQIVKEGLKQSKLLFQTADVEMKRAIALRRKSIMYLLGIAGFPYCGQEMQEHDKTISVRMPVNDKGEFVFQNIYHHGIRSVELQLDIDLQCADGNMSNVTNISEICKGIQKSRHTIIDFSDWNSNELLEFGFVSGLREQTVFIKNKISDVHIDLYALEYISCRNNYENLQIRIVENLEKIIEKSYPKKDRRLHAQSKNFNCG